MPLDLLPASLIDSIKVQKTHAPDLPGESLAGLVQVETAEFPTRPTLNVSYSIGYNSQTQGHDAGPQASQLSRWWPGLFRN